MSCAKPAEIVYDIIEKHWLVVEVESLVVVVKKIMMCRREDGGIVVKKIIKSWQTFDKHSCDLLTAIMHTKILVAYFIIPDKKNEILKAKWSMI